MQNEKVSLISSEGTRPHSGGETDEARLKQL